jgi:cytochrome P450
MTLFTPPKPAPLPERPGLIRRARLIAHSSLAILQGGSYAAPKVGRMGLPKLPGRRKRWVYQVRDPARVREMLVTRVDAFPKAGLMGWMLRPLTGESIFTTNGEVWRRQRRLVDPALEQARVRDSFSRMRDAAEAALVRLRTAASGDGAVAVDDEMTLFAADVIFRTIFSEPIDPAEAKEAVDAFERFQALAYAHGMFGLAGVPEWLMPGTWARIRAGKRLRRVLKRPLDRRLARIAAGEAPPADILATLMTSRDPETGSVFAPEELLDQVAMLFLAGHETSASALAWALYLLSEAPDVQARARDEVVSAVGSGPIAFEHMKRLDRVRNVFREALRLYPPVTTVVRECVRPEPMGRNEAQPGDPLFITPWVLHRLSDVWSHPDAFDPDRFETEEGRNAVRQAYLPFSVGPRVCPGAAFALQEATVMLALILRDFNLTRAEGARTPEPVAKLTLRSATGVTLRLKRL